jgi:hypothetical protein
VTNLNDDILSVNDSIFDMNSDIERDEIKYLNKYSDLNIQEKLNNKSKKIVDYSII